MMVFARRVAVFSLGLGMVAGVASSAHAQEHWVGSWATSPMGFRNADGKWGADGAGGTTLREIVHLSIGGPAVRVVLTNEFGVEPLIVTDSSVAVAGTGGAVAGTPIALTFGGRNSVTIPPGALAVSDAAALTVAPLSDLAVSLFIVPQPLEGLTRHAFGNTTSYLVPGNATLATELKNPKTFTSWDFLKGVDVAAGADSAAIVAFGDSITDGARSTKDKNAGWPSVLAARLAANPKTAKLGVLNEGIGGNRILHDGTGPSALARFDRDVLAQDGVKYLVILEAINDIGHAYDTRKPYDVVTADDLIAGYKQMIARAHLKGIKVFLATLTPYVTPGFTAGYSSAAGEKVREAVNDWIRTNKDADGFVDFEKATMDPANPGVFLPADDGGDHLHPSDTGYKAMGDSIDLSLFTK